MTAARGDADEGKAALRTALAARHATDRGTLERVAEVLHRQLGGIEDLLLRERVNAAAGPMERRTYTPLHRRPGGAR